jgi:hypothetical protein
MLLKIKEDVFRRNRMRSSTLLTVIMTVLPELLGARKYD